MRAYLRRRSESASPSPETPKSETGVGTNGVVAEVPQVCSSLNRAYCTMTAHCMWLCSQVFLGLEAPCGAECLPPLWQLCAWAALRSFGVIR